MSLLRQSRTLLRSSLKDRLKRLLSEEAPKELLLNDSLKELFLRGHPKELLLDYPLTASSARRHAPPTRQLADTH